MTDFADRAEERIEEMLADALAEHARHDPTAGKTLADSAEQCDGCGAGIPDARRHAVPGVRLCVASQEDADRMAAAARRNGRRQ